MDYVTIDSLRIVGKHGHFEQERRVEQEFVVSLKVGFDAKPAGKSDELVDTIDFDVLKNIVERTFAEKSRYLVEALAEEIAQKILAQTPAKEATVSIQKTAVWPNGVPGIVVTRSK
jgi:dihydroneopterin aldolase